jgi:hypothetical protein
MCRKTDWLNSFQTHFTPTWNNGCGNKSNVNLKDMMQQLATEFLQSLQQHAILAEAFEKYQQAVQRLSNFDRSKASASRKVMTQPRNRYQGLQPVDYEHCLNNYDDEQFQNIRSNAVPYV